MKTDNYRIYTQTDIKAVLRDNRYHQSIVWKELLMMIPAELLRTDTDHQRQVVDDYRTKAFVDPKYLKILTHNVNRRQVKRAIAAMADLENRDTDMFMDLQSAMARLSESSKIILLDSIALGYSDIEIYNTFFKDSGKDIEIVSQIITIALDTITRQLER